MTDANKKRIVRVKGNEYVQEAIYSWDPETKRGKTIVTKHLGPLKNFSKKEVKEIKRRIEINKSKKETKRKGNTEKTIDGVGKEYPPLTPSEETIEQVYKIINEANVFQSRNEVYQKHMDEYPTQKENEELKKNVGFALTILERNGQIKKIGKGGKKDPYRYGHNSLSYN